MRPRTVLLLTVLVAALGAFVWFFERDLPSSEERAERSRKVLPVEPDAVTALALEWGGETVRLERARAERAEAEPGAEDAGEGAGEETEPFPPGEWRLTEPLRARAERSAVDGLLNALAGLDKVRTLEDADRAAVGLAEPRGRVTLATEEGERTLEIGADVPGSENVLVSVAGEPEIWVTRRSFLTHLDREPGEWRARDVFAVARDDVARLRLSGAGGGEPVVLARRDERFYLEEPIEDVAASDAVDRLLSDLATLRARRFLDSPGEEGAQAPPPGELGLDPPRAVVLAELTEGGEPLRVELGAPVPAADGDAAAGGGAVYARAAGQLFEAVTDLDEAAARPVRDWRSRSWTEIRSYEVDRVEAAEAGGAAPVVLVREGVDWRRGDETIPYTAASDFLFAVTDAEGELAEGSPAETASGEAVLTVTLASEEGDEEILTLLPAREDGAHPARSSSRTAVLLLTDETVAEVLRTLAEIRTAEPVAAEAEGEASDGS